MSTVELTGTPPAIVVEVIAPGGPPGPQGPPGEGTAGAMTLTDLTDVTGTPGPNKAPVYDEHTGIAPLTQVPTQADIDAILAKVVWHKVDALADPWQPSNPSAVLTPDGVTFGPYTDGATTGGSIRYLGLNGQPFSAVRNLAYSMRFTSDTISLDASSAPYLRVYTQDAAGGAHDAIFTPGSQTYRAGYGPGPVQEFVATAGTWRWDSDDGSNSEFGTGVPLAEIQAKYGDQPITKIAITLGWTTGTNLAGLLRWWQIQNANYIFGGSP